MPYQIQLHVEKEYQIKKNNWLYTLYYDLKDLIIHNYHDIKLLIEIGTFNTNQEIIYETFYYLVMNKYGGLHMDRFIKNVHSGMHNAKEEIFLDQLYCDYDDNDKEMDEDTYVNLKFIEFLTNQTDSIEDIHQTCLIYCDNSYMIEWFLSFECTE